MSNSIHRRDFLTATAVMTAVAGAKSVAGAEREKSGKKQEYYEIRIYKAKDGNKKKLLARYLEKAIVPAFGRMGIDRIGVFTNMDDSNDYSMYVVIPYPTLEVFSDENSRLLTDREYLNAAKEHFAAPMDDPLFTRIESKLYKAFAGMPVIELPEQTAGNKPRIFELRIYESHTEEKAALKVDMFNGGEMQVMRDTGLAPVFYGEALIGNDLPHLAYMLSASGREAHEEHWAKFRDHPEWLRMREMPKYKDTVSKITNFFLMPTAYSQI